VDTEVSIQMKGLAEARGLIRHFFKKKSDDRITGIDLLCAGIFHDI
jgi:hypothetical protein